MPIHKEEQMITCCKCHGEGSYPVPQFAYEDSAFPTHYDVRKCELCGGKGKITLQFYEEIQRKCGEK